MAIWKLEPVDLSSKHWAASLHTGVAIVRAPNEELARHLASDAFGIVPGADAGRLFSPWIQVGLVRCSQLARSDFRDDGPPTVLDPPHYGATPAASVA